MTEIEQNTEGTPLSILSGIGVRTHLETSTSDQNEYRRWATWGLDVPGGAISSIWFNYAETFWMEDWEWSASFTIRGPGLMRPDTALSTLSGRHRNLPILGKVEVAWSESEEHALGHELAQCLTHDEHIRDGLAASEFEVEVTWEPIECEWSIQPHAEVTGQRLSDEMTIGENDIEALKFFIPTRQQWDLYQAIARAVQTLGSV
jgi:hypothetical protein